MPFLRRYVFGQQRSTILTFLQGPIIFYQTPPILSISPSTPGGRTKDERSMQEAALKQAGRKQEGGWEEAGTSRFVYAVPASPKHHTTGSHYLFSAHK